MADILAVLATSYGILMAISPVLQIRRMRATGSSADVSIGYLAVLQPGFILWLSYGLAIGNPALVISNSAALVFGMLTMLLAIRLRRAHRRERGLRASIHEPGNG
jgi:MtN3 and saliva related transmembrane protein